ncbi:MAG: hypothetical protein ACRD6I_11575 [Candidatus Acidiferrales bacterium]
MSTRAKIIAAFATIGLLGPFLALSGSLHRSELVSVVSVVLWPTWMIGWAVIPYRESLTAQTVVIAVAVSSNVIAFALLGWVYSKFDFKRRALNYALVLPAYGVIYGAAALIIGALEWVYTRT